MSPKGYHSSQTAISIGLLARDDFFKSYKIRKAVEEDNDDIVRMIDSYSTKFKKLYGEYYISELLTRVEGTTRHIIVAELNGYAVAVVIINEDVDYDFLNEMCEVGAFHGFREAHINDDYLLPIEPSRQPSVTLEDLDFEIMPFDTMNIRSPTISSFDSSPDYSLVYSESESSSEEEWAIDPTIDLSTLVVNRDPDKINFSSLFKMGSQVSLLSTCLLNTDEYMTNSLLPSQASSMDVRAFRNELLKKYKLVRNFYGETKAFALEVVVCEPEHVSAITTLIDSAFKCCIDKNYCLLCTPTSEPPVNYLNEFVRVTPKNHSVFPHDVFVLHRNSIECKIKVRLALNRDFPYIEEFLNQMLYSPVEVQERITKLIQRGDDNIITLIMICERQIIGVAVVDEYSDTTYLYSHYSLHKWVDETKHCGGSVGVLENFLIYPVFHRFCPHFLAEIHRLADFSLLLHFVSSKDMENSLRDRPILNCLQYLIPVTPRHLPEYDTLVLEESICPSDDVTELKEPFALFISLVRLTGIKRIEINSRIVVVGTGDTAIAFLEKLLFGSSPDLLVTFNNITVVSPHGLPFSKESSKVKNIQSTGRTSSFYHRILHMNLRVYVNTVHGVLNMIARKEKWIIVNEVAQIPYDYLVLFCGEQYQLPKLQFKAGRKFADFPENTFMINTDNDVAQVFNKIHRHKKDFRNSKYMRDDYIIVYGQDIRALACLASLIENGIPASVLALIEPNNVQKFSRESFRSPNLIFPDPEISETVDTIIMQLGVKVYKGYVLKDWEINDNNKVTSVEVVCKNETLHIGCKFIFIYAEKSISNKTYHAIFGAGLVFDGRLVIDKNFCTNDPSIFAAGPLTQYSRKYHAEHKSHVYYNAREIGETIGQQFRDMLIPEEFKKFERKRIRRTVPEDEILQVDKILPTFWQPIVIYCMLPGSVFYLSISPPGKHVPVELMMTSDNYGRLLVTGDYEHITKQGYFRLHINRMNTVESICCLSKEPVDINNLVTIWGKHVSLLNDVLSRFEAGMINDLFEFFKEPFIYGIVYDKFPDLMEDIRELFLDTEIEEEQTIAEAILKFCKKNNWKFLTDHQNYEVNCLLQDSTLISQVEKKLLEYIYRNKTHLPMYAHPSLVQNVLEKHKKSPMFSK